MPPAASIVEQKVAGMATRTLALAAITLASLLRAQAQQQTCITPYQSCLNNDDLSYTARALNVRLSWLSSWDLPHADAHAHGAGDWPVHGLQQPGIDRNVLRAQERSLDCTTAAGWVDR